jgi:hypothetical protein
VVEAVGNPRPETVPLEEHSFLSELVQLGISVQKSSGDELITDSHRKWRENREEDVVEGESP